MDYCYLKDFFCMILNSSKIYVIDKGKVLAEGSHEDLMSKSSVYKNFYSKQVQKN